MFIKENYPLVSKVYYFSDGCGGQYKNYKNFINLCHHKEDFGLNAEIEIRVAKRGFGH